MVRGILMATLTNAKGTGKAVLSEKSTAAVSTMKNKAQARSFQSKSSPVYKSQSEVLLDNSLRNLSLRETPTRVLNRRAYNAASGKTTIRNLSDVADVIRDQLVKNVVIVAGAGISTSSGIPDFRTPGTGLYDNLQQYNIPYPEAIFDIDYFHHNPRPFFTLAKELYPSVKYRPNYIHYFARLLHEKGQLLRMYTQNIDGLERLAGIPPNKLVEAHGTFASATCVICSQKYSGDDIKETILGDKYPRCKRSSCPGIVKPDIVFFGEELPKRFYYYLKDMINTDLVLVMGTSLEVQPFAGIIDNVRMNIPRVLFNRNAVGPFRHHKRCKDIVAAGDLLDTMQKFVGMMDWKIDMADLIKKCEGEFKIANIPPTTPLKAPQKIKAATPSPIIAMWRGRARFDLFRDNFSSSSSESDSSSSSYSDSSEDEKSQSSSMHKQKNMRSRGVRTDIPNRKFITPARRAPVNTQKADTKPGTTQPVPKKNDTNGNRRISSGNQKISSTNQRISSGNQISSGNRTSPETRPLTRSRSKAAESKKDPPVRETSTTQMVPDSNKASSKFRRRTSITPSSSEPSSSSTESKGKTCPPKTFDSPSSNPRLSNAKENGQTTRLLRNRPPVPPSSTIRAAAQQRTIFRQKMLFRAGSAQTAKLTYRHRPEKPTRNAQVAFYANQTSSESTTEISSSSSDDDGDFSDKCR